MRWFMCKIIGYVKDTRDLLNLFWILSEKLLTATLFIAHTDNGFSDQRAEILDFILSQHVSGEPITFPLLCYHAWKLKVERVTSPLGIGMATAFPLVSWRRNGKSQLSFGLVLQRVSTVHLSLRCRRKYAFVRSCKPPAQRSSFIWKGLASWCVFPSSCFVGVWTFGCWDVLGRCWHLIQVCFVFGRAAICCSSMFNQIRCIDKDCDHLILPHFCWSEAGRGQ